MYTERIRVKQLHRNRKVDEELICFATKFKYIHTYLNHIKPRQRESWREGTKKNEKNMRIKLRRTAEAPEPLASLTVTVRE